MSKPTKIYPVRGRWLPGVPTAVQVVATKGEADDLIATGAFTDNPNDPDRDRDAADQSGEPVSFAEDVPRETPVTEAPPEP